MATAATVQINLDANSARLLRELSQAKKKTNSTFRSIAKSAADVTKKLALIGTAAGGALAALAANSAQSIDALAKTSDKLGVTTEALTSLRLAANLTGVETRQLDLGIQRMTRRISEAAQGTGEAQGALRELGLDAQKINQLPLDEQFKAIAARMANVSSQADRVRLGFKLFDAEGVSLINTLALGAEGLEDVRKEAEQLGLAVSRVDAKKIEEMNDAILLSRKAFEGIGNTIAIAVSPLVTKLATDFVTAAKGANAFTTEVNSGMAGLLQVIGGIGDAFLGWKIIFQGVAIAIFNELANLSGRIAALLEDIGGVGIFGDKINSLALAFRDRERDFQGSGQVIKDAIADAFNQPLPSDNVREYFKEAAAEAEQRTKELNDLLAGFGGGEGGGTVVTTKVFQQSLDDLVESHRVSREQMQAVDLLFNRARIRNQEITNDELKSLAETQARQTVEQRFEAEGKFDRTTGTTTNEAERVRFNQELRKQELANLQEFLKRKQQLEETGVTNRATAEQSLQQVVEASRLANEQILESETLFQVAQIANRAVTNDELVELAKKHAFETVMVEFESRNAALDETGQFTNEEDRLAFEEAVRAQELANLKSFLDERNRLELQGSKQFSKTTALAATFMGKTWAAQHKKTIATTAQFATQFSQVSQQIFGDTKAAQVATAIVNTAAGVSQALAAYPPPFSFAMAALVAAAGLVQITKIKSTNIGGGGTAASVGVGGGASVPRTGGGGGPEPSTNFNQTTEEREAAPTAVHVHFDGTVVGGDAAAEEWVTSVLKRAVDDRDVLIISGASRQAAEIRDG
jgi:hypothetical protein